MKEERKEKIALDIINCATLKEVCEKIKFQKLHYIAYEKNLGSGRF